MTHAMYAITLMLFVANHYANTAERKPTIPVSKEEQNGRDANARLFKQTAIAYGGKMLDLDDDEQAVDKTAKIMDTPTKPNDIRARL